VRVAWFSPLPPARSGIADYTAEVTPLIGAPFDIHLYGDANAFDFVWTHRQSPYDLVVYQLGNARAHDFIWGYLAAFPGLVVLHDARLHHARARLLLASGRDDDYRAEFQYDQPAMPPGAADYTVEGLGGAVSYFWPMLRVPVTTARLVAVHNARVARDIAERYPSAAIETMRMGVPPPRAAADARAAIRRRLGITDAAVVFAAFGKLTAEKRIQPILDAIAHTRARGDDAVLLIVGEADGYQGLSAEITRRGLNAHVHAAGYVPPGEIGGYLAAADACLCLRWPTALETSASWIRCLAASRPTVVTSLPHLADVPRDVALRVDVLNEQATLDEAVRRLAREPALRDRLARAGHAYWAAHHTLDHMAEDYRRVLASAAARPVPTATGLPAHVVDDYSGRADAIARELGVAPDVLEPFRR